MACFKGWIYFFLWYSSILAGYAGLFCPLFPVLLLSNRLYRFIVDVIFTFWQSYPTALLEFLCRCDVQILGDPIESNEVSLLMMNHRTRTDWTFLWPAVYHSTRGPTRYKHPTKFILKDVVRHIPGIGWVMQLACFVYIKRIWTYDKEKIQKLIDYFHDISYKYSLLIFPEGTDFTNTTREISKNYAKKNNLLDYEYVLHPRTTGFIYLTKQLLAKGTLDAIYDLTLVYPDFVPQTEKMLFNDGNFPKQVKMHFTRYPVAVLPKAEDELKHFLESRWLEKEKVLKEFYATGHFLHGEILKRTDVRSLYFSFIFWTVFPYFILYIFYTSVWFRLIVIAHTALILIANCVSDGFSELEIKIHQIRRRIFFDLI